MSLRCGWRFAAVVAVGFVCDNQARFGLAQAEENCVLAGTVFNSATNAGIAHALVEFTGNSSGFRFTDAGGNFRVADLPCGFVTLMVSKPGFVAESDQSAQLPEAARFTGMLTLATQDEDRPSRAPQPARQSVELKPDSVPVRVQLVPLSSIVGSALDQNGEPLPGVGIQTITVKATLDGTDYVPGQTVTVDDRGHFSLLNLTPGDYIVRLAGEVSSTRYYIGSTLNTHNDHRGMPPVYYPNADSVSSATPIHLIPGERGNANFRQATERAFDIDGRLSGFVPQAWTQVQLYREGDRLPLGAAYVNLSSGQFRIVDVPRGNYTLRAVQYQSDPPVTLAAETPIEMGSEPMRNVIVELSKGVSIPVTVSYEAGAQPGGIVSLMLMPQHMRRNRRHLFIGKVPMRRRPNADRSDATPQPEEEAPGPTAFTDVIPDTYKLVSMPAGLEGNNYVAAAKFGELDVLHGEFPIGAGGEIHITIRGDSATLEGQVVSDGKPVTEAHIYLIPAKEGSAGLKSGISGEGGHYQVAAPPGDYRIQAWTGCPTTRDILAVSGESITLQPNEKRTMTLQAAPGSGPAETEGGRPLW